MLPLLGQVCADVEHRRDKADRINFEDLLELEHLQKVLQGYLAEIEFLI